MRVILFILKCFVGLFATIGLFAVAGVAVLAVIAAQGDWRAFETKEEIPDSTVLMLDFGSGVVETQPDNPLSRAAVRNTIKIRESLEALDAAGRDKRIKGLVARVGQGQLGLARVQELRNAIVRFRGHGKFAYAFSESFGEGGNGTQHYYLASAFDEVWMQPSGMLDITGLALQSPFLREALDELGIEPQLGQREEYKGIMNLLTDTSLPEPQRKNLQRLLDSMIGQIAAGVAEQRDMEAALIRSLIDGAPHMAAEALEAGLVDRLGYWDELNDRVLEEVAAEDPYLELASYDSLRDHPEAEGPVVGLIYGLGPVHLGLSESDPAFGRTSMGADTVAQGLADAIDDPDVAAIVFRVDSPGGSYVASDVIWREMQRAREAGKPVIVSMGETAASGGYFVAAPAATIVAQPGTVTGSIGVVAGKVVLSGLWDRLGIAWDGVQAGNNAGIWSLNQRFSESGWNRLQGMLDGIYLDFTTKVAEGRGMTREAVLQVAKGQLWTGADAQVAGLVDELGGFHRAVALAAEAAGAAPDERVQLRRFPEQRDPVAALFEDFMGTGVAARNLTVALHGFGRATRTMEPLIEAAERLNSDPRSRMLRAPELAPAN